MIASISVIESSGKLATPTAILECFPFSPNISKNKSEAGLFQKKKNLFQDLEKYYDLVVTKREKDLERLWLDGMLEAKKNPKLKKILIKLFSAIKSKSQSNLAKLEIKKRRINNS